MRQFALELPLRQGGHCRQPAIHLGGDAQPPGFPEGVASQLSQRHLARFGDHFRRSGIPIKLWAGWADIGFGGEPTMMLSSNKQERNAPGRRQRLTALMALNQPAL